MEVTVYDLAYDEDGELVHIEDLLAAQGDPAPSHDDLRVPIHAGVECPITGNTVVMVLTLHGPNGKTLASADAKTLTKNAVDFVNLAGGTPKILLIHDYNNHDEDNADVAALAATGAPRFVAVVYDLGQDKGISEPLRIAQPTASPSPHIALLASDASPDVTLFSIAEGRVGWVAGVEEIGASEVGNEWLSVDGISSYVQDRRTELLAKQGALSVVESSGSTPLFGWTVLPAGAGALAPGVKSYFEKAKKEVAGVSPSDLCVAPVWDAIAAGKTGARLARACAAGALVSVPDLSLIHI